jgi:magnesium-transporting ATPase (P-type)
VSELSPIWAMASLPFTVIGYFGFWLLFESAWRIAKSEKLRFGLSRVRMAGLVWFLTFQAVVVQLVWAVSEGIFPRESLVTFLVLIVVSAPLFIGVIFGFMKTSSKIFERYTRKI